jgi:hypothetical protein
VPRPLLAPEWHPLNPPKVAPFYPAPNNTGLFLGQVVETAYIIRISTHIFDGYPQLLFHIKSGSPQESVRSPQKTG